MKYKSIYKGLLAIILFTGCSQKLDLSPLDTMSDATFWKTASDFKLGANNLYLSLPIFNRDDLGSDIAFSYANSISNGTYQVTETDANWNDPYLYIRRCNNIIEKANAFSGDAAIQRFAAEVKFFRAFNYWKLFRLYGGAPIITKVLDINDEQLYAARAGRKETVDFIIQDLKEAAAILPEKSSLANVDVGRITKGAANALMARVALFEGTWSKFHNVSNANEYLDIAINASQSVINSAQYDLYTGKGSESYRYLFIEEGDDSRETILDRRYQLDIAPQWFPYDLDQECYLPTKKLADMYLCKDGLPITKSSLFKGYGTMTSEYEDRDPRMTMTMIIPGTYTNRPLYSDPVINYPFFPQRIGNTGYILYKYMSEQKYVRPKNNSNDYDLHVIRYAEVLLIYAEAVFERNGSISDADLNKSINIIRNRVNMPALTNALAEANGLDMRTEIRRERSIELAMEGFRYDDLRRWKTAEIELPEAIKGIDIKIPDWQKAILDGGVKNLYADQTWQSNTDENGFIVSEKASDRHFDPAKHYLRPIPTKEILINPKLEQNPGW
jgi:hypothetical protein